MHDGGRRARQNFDVRHVGGQRAAHSRDELRPQRFERGARVAKDVGWRLRDDFDRPSSSARMAACVPGPACALTMTMGRGDSDMM